MSERDDGGPAFPSWDYQMMGDSGGMTVRDYFAAKAMAIAAQENPDESVHVIARLSYGLADAMLAERAK